MCEPKRVFYEKTLFQTVCILSFLIFLTAATGSAGAEIESQERILETARSFLTDLFAKRDDQDIRIEIGQLDSRLRLTRCDAPPTARLAPGATLERISTVNIRCSTPVSWSLFVPVRVERYMDVIVAASPIARQQIIRHPDIRVERTEVSRLSTGYLDDPAAVIGLEAQRSMNPGQVLTSSHVARPLLVKRGQRVTITASKPGLSVRMSGEAMEDGVVGQRIQVRNRSSQRIVEGYVQPSGNIRIAL